jgi:hypothetical protein
MTHCRPLAVEHLEDRLAPSTSGVTWPDGSHLTLSFAPDGTHVGDRQSNLFASLNAVAPTAAWQAAILRAFQAWAAPANVNVGVVADGGQDLGSTGIVQGDARFGDIRIAAVPLGPTTLITNTQFQWSGTSWSGDVVINSSNLFRVSGGSAGSVDLYTAMLNEAGNVLGVLDTRTDTTSGVYYQYVGPKAGINAGDVADVRSLYGSRSADQYDAAASNGTLATATNFGLALTGVNADADVTTAADVDYYKFSIPVLVPAVTGLTVRLKTSGLSTLVGALQVYDASGHSVGSATATDPLHGDLMVQVTGGGLLGQLLGGGTYYVRVADGNNSAFGVGSYNLNVSYNLANGAILGPFIGGLIDPGGGLNNTLAAALALPSNLLNGNKPDARFDYTVKATISSPNDADYYRIQVPTGSGRKMNVLVWALQPNRLLPRVDVYDTAGHQVPSTLLANENGTFSVEVANVVSGGAYSIKVSALNPGGSHGTGDYFLGVDTTSQPPTALSTFATGRLTAAASQTWTTLTVGQNQLYEFILSASATAQAEVRLDIYDMSGNVVFTLRSYAGQPASTGDVYLTSGRYTLRFSAAAPSGSALPVADYSLTGRVISDPIGPRQDKDTDPVSSGPTKGEPIERDTSATAWDPPYYA